MANAIKPFYLFLFKEGSAFNKSLDFSLFVFPFQGASLFFTFLPLKRFFTLPFSFFSSKGASLFFTFLPFYLFTFKKPFYLLKVPP